MNDVLQFIDKMRNEIYNRVDAPLIRFQDRSKQLLLCNAIRYIDSLFENDVMGSRNISKRTADIIEFGFPALLRTVKLDNKNLEGMMLLPSDELMKQQIEMILDEFYIAGLLETCRNYVKYGLLEESRFEKQLILKFKETYHFMERLDKISTVIESNNTLYRLMPYNFLMASESEPILKRMEELLYLWNNDFIGYGAHEDVDQYYIDNAVIDLLQETDWDIFEEKNKFGGIEYGIFIDAIVFLEMVALKHLQFVYLAIDKYKTLDKFNILPVIAKKEIICESLSDFLSIDMVTAEKVFSLLSFRQSQSDEFWKKNLPLPPYVEMAKDYYIRSLAGCLYEPVSYFLYNLKKEYPRDWDINIQKREERFREEIYDFFPDDLYIKYSKNIIIKEGKKVVTDIDGCLYEKATGYICFLQLKWQDTIYDSFKSMLSKKTNYINKVNEWIETMQEWTNSVSVNTIADYLQLSPRDIDKSKIRLIVVGRFNGRYSTSEKNNNGSVYCQWFELKRMLHKYAESMTAGEQTFNELYEKLEEAMKRKEEKRREKKRNRE